MRKYLLSMLMVCAGLSLFAMPMSNTKGSPTQNWDTTLKWQPMEFGELGTNYLNSMNFLDAEDFVGTGVGAIPDGGPGCGPSGAALEISFNVTGMTGDLEDISLSMTANHTWMGDVRAELYAPDGTMLTIFSRTGGTTATSCGDSSELDGFYNFTDSASTNWWAAAATAGFGAVIPSGDYRTTAPAPQPSAGTSPVTSMVDAFSGVADLNGTWVLRMYDHGGGDTGSVTAATLSIETADGGGGLSYCIPQGTNVNRYINNFSTTGGTTNLSNLASGFSTGGYGDFTTTHSLSQDPEESVNFTADIMGGIAGFRIWVDWNQDGVFDPVTEVAYQSTGYLSTQSGSFVVPASAAPGETRMRVVSHWLSTTGSVDPCATGFTYGEFEDYTFEVTGGGGPVGDPCAQETPSNGFENGHGYIHTAHIAHDFRVEPGITFSVEQFTFNALITSPTATVTLSFYEDVGGQPGTFIDTTPAIVPTSQTTIGTAFGFNVVSTVVDLPTPMVFEGGATGTNYFVAVNISNPTNSFWESTSIMNTQRTGYYSGDGGTTWSALTPGGPWDGVFEISGTCEGEPIEPEGCEWTVTVEGTTWGDEVSWELRDSGGSVLLSAADGDYGNGYFDVQTIAAEGPVEFYIEAIGFFDDNTPSYTVSNGTEVLVTGQLLGGDDATYSDLNCDDAGGPTDPVYCGPLAFTLNVEPITNVEVADIAHTSDPVVDGSPAHEDFTAVVGNMEQGENYPIALEGNTAGNFENRFVVFIDWNQNGTLDDAGEVYEMDNTIQNSTGTDGQQALGTIAVPADAELGNTRMRVKKIFGTTNFLNPCLGASFGQAEDYTINVTEVTGPTGCLTGTLFPATTFTPLCVGDPEVIATNAWAGEYTNVNVTGGTTYTFTSANATTTDFITIGNADGTIVLASGMSPLVWTATSNQVVRFYNHLDAACTTQNTSRTKAVACGDPIIVEEPDFACFQGDGLAGNGENGYSVFAGSVNRTADDFIVDDTFTMEQVTLFLLTQSPITNVNLVIRADNAGAPGTIEETIPAIVPTSQDMVGAAFGYYIHEVVLDLPTALELTAGTYWLQPEATNTAAANVFWEVTSTGTLGGAVYRSTDTGATWTVDVNGFDAVFFVSGTCDVVEPEDGCFVTGTFDQWPSTTYVAQCIGTVEVITGAGWAGEFSKVQVTAGTEYIFASSVSTDFITIADEDEEITFATGTGSVTWTSPINQVIRFYTHLNDECEIEEVSRTRSVQCGDIPPPPVNDECADAIALSCGDSATGSTIAANNSGGNAAGDVFYTFTGTGTEELVTVSLCGSSYDTYVRVFSDCTLSTQIAFNDDACGLQSEVTFLSDGTSTYVIMVEGFSSNTGAYTIDVSCELPPPPPADCEDHEVLSNNLENGYFFTNQLAADVPVADTGFTVYGVDLNVFIEGAPEGLTFSATFYNSVSGMPGSTVEHTTNAAIYASEFVGTAFGYDIYNYIIAFETPAVLDANTTYWMSIDSDGVAWEATTASTLGSVGYINTGAGWAPTDGGEEFVYKLVCEELGISDMNSFDFTYYPNPVKDVLNIDSKQSVENVSVFNLAGQKVIADAKVSNGQINVNALTPGTYVFRVTLEGGQVETFKIIKK